MITMGSAGEFALIRLSGGLDDRDAVGLRDALTSLDSEPVIIVALESSIFFDRSITGVLVRADRRLARNLIVVLPTDTRLPQELRYAPTLDVAIALARTLRDIAAASFSRDGVATVVSDSDPRD